MNHRLNHEVQFIHLANIDYQAGWDFQDRLFQSIIETKLKNRDRASEDQLLTSNYLIFCSHPHVFTLGKSGSMDHLLADDTLLKQRGARFYKINRGGDITYHGPGQIVGYPILDLDNFFTDIHRYLRLLEEAIICTLADYGIVASRNPGFTGVWIDAQDHRRARKICAMGVRTSRWVTMHGFAFNVNVDLSYFDLIVPCGIANKQVTSMQKELGRAVDERQVEEALKGHLVRLFDMNLITAEDIVL